MIHLTNRKTGSSFFLILMMTLVTILSFSMTEAHAARKPIGVTFKKLNVSVKKIKNYNGYRTNQVTIEYSIRRGDWRQLNRYDIIPKLTIATTRYNTRLKSFRVEHRKGRFQFHTRTKVADKLKLRISGRNNGVTIDENGYKKQCKPWLKIAVKRYRQHHNDHGVSYGGGHGHGELSAVMQACKTRNVSKVRCSKLMRKVGQRRAPAIFKACAANTKWGSDFASCVTSAGSLKRGAAKAVYACAGPSDGWNSNLVSCLKTVATINYNPSSLIRACDVATKWFSDFKSCVQVAAPVDDSSHVVQACDRATKWGSDLRGCIKSAQGLHDPASVVEMCAQTTDWASELNRCVKNGGPYARRSQRHRRTKNTRSYKKRRYTRR